MNFYASDVNNKLHLSKQGRQELYVSDYLKSAREQFPSPWLCPLGKCIGPLDNRESSRWNTRIVVINLAATWSRDRAVIHRMKQSTFGHSIVKKSFLGFQYVRRHLSEDKEIIVLGHRDSTVRRWNVSTGESIGAYAKVSS